MLQSRGFEIESWDFSPYISPTFYNNYSPSDICTFNGIKEINSVNQAKINISNLIGSEIILSLLSYGGKELIIYRLLKKKKNHLGVQLLNIIPTGTGFKDTSKSYSERFTYYLNEIIKDPELLFNYIYKFSKRVMPTLMSLLEPLIFKMPNFVLMGGQMGKIDHRYAINATTRKVWCHAMDYDLFLQGNNTKPISDNLGKYIVFLDEYLPFCPDFDLLNLPPDCTEDNYYPPLVHFFDFLEEKTGYKVIIAAHPLSAYNLHKDYFEGRRIIKGQTQQLVKNSKFVLAHESTAISFAVLYLKAVIFITHDSISRRYNQLIIHLADCLGKKPLNLSNQYPEEISDQLIIDYDIYATYKTNYIKTPDTPEKNTWDIFADYYEDFIITS